MRAQRPTRLTTIVASFAVGGLFVTGLVGAPAMAATDAADSTAAETAPTPTATVDPSAPGGPGRSDAPASAAPDEPSPTSAATRWPDVEPTPAVPMESPSASAAPTPAPTSSPTATPRLAAPSPSREVGPTRSIAGHVTLGGDARAGFDAVKVTCWSYDARSGTFERVAWTDVDAAGAFSCSGLPATGRHRIGVDGGVHFRTTFWRSDAVVTEDVEEGEDVPADVADVELRAVASGTVRGRLALPSGFRFSAGSTSLWAQAPSALEPLRRADIASDGTFVVEGLPTEGSVRLWLRDRSVQVVEGYVTDAGLISASVDDAARVPVGADLLITTESLVAITGTVAWPSTYVWKAGNLRATAYPVGLGEWVQVDVASDGTFRIEGLTPRAGYRLRLSDGTGELNSGYLSADGRLVETTDPARTVEAPAVVAIRAERLVALVGQVQAPPGTGGTTKGVVYVSRPGASRSAAQADVTADAMFVVRGLRPEQEYVVRYWSASSTIHGGYYAGATRPLASSESDATPVHAGESQIVLRPRAAARMSGRVVRPEGYTGDLANITLTLLADPEDSLRTVASVKASSDGSFAFEGLEHDGVYALYWRGPGIASAYLGVSGTGVEWNTDLRVLPPMSSLVIRVQALQSITGRVVLPGGVSDYSTLSLTATGGFDEEVDIAANGTFAVTGLDPWHDSQFFLEDRSGRLADGYYTASDSGLAATASDATWVKAGTTGIVLWPSPTVTISGSVPELAGVGGVLVSARRDEDVDTDDVLSAPLSDDGTFVIEGAARGGRYAVRLSTSSAAVTTGYYDGTTMTADLEEAQLVTAPASALVLPAVRLTDITVRASWKGSGDLPSAQVTAYDARGRTYGPVDVDASGKAVVERLAPGEAYRLEVTGDVAPGWFAGDRAPLAATSTGGAAVFAGTDVEAVLDEPATISGTVTGTTWPDLQLWDIETGELVRSFSARTGDDGKFTRGGLPVGTFVIGINGEDGTSQYAPSYYVDGQGPTSRRSNATPVAFVPGGQVNGVALAEAACATYSGYVEVPYDHLRLTTVRMWSDDPDVPARRTRLWDTFDFAVHGLVPATYHVELATEDSPPLRLDDAVIGGCTETTGAVLGDRSTITPLRPPVVTGQGGVGDVLTSTSGAWSVQPDDLEYQWTRNGEPIPGATSSEYRTTLADFREALRVTVTPVKAGYAGRPATSGWFMVRFHGDLPPGSVELDGDPKVGGVLRATAYGWSEDAELLWSWERDGWTIHGADQSTYVPQPGDAGAVITARVRATAPGYLPAMASATSTRPVAFAFVALAGARLDGKAAVGSALRASDPTWSGRPDAVRYQWFRDSRALPGATAPTYVPQPADLGTKLYVQITASLAGWPDIVVRTSEAVVARGTIAVTRAPAVTGTARVGSTLRTTGGTWTPTDVSLHYQWMRGTTPISGATAAGYTLRAADLDKVVTVRVVATSPGYASLSATSDAKAPVAKGVLRNTSKPTISGTPAVTKTLRVSKGAWSADRVTATYQWFRDGKRISGATSSTYRLGRADVGKRMSVTVTARATGYLSASVPTRSTRQVAKAVARVRLTLSSTTVQRPTSPSATVSVVVPLVADPTGRVVVHVGRKRYAASLSAEGRGQITIPLTYLQPGEYAVKAVFYPRERTAGVATRGESRTIRLVVTAPKPGSY